MAEIAQLLELAWQKSSSHAPPSSVPPLPLWTEMLFTTWPLSPTIGPPPTAGVNAEKRCYLAMKRRDLDGFLYVHAGTAWWMGRSGPGPGGERGQEVAGVSRKRRERRHVLDT